MIGYNNAQKVREIPININNKKKSHFGTKSSSKTGKKRRKLQNISSLAYINTLTEYFLAFFHIKKSK